MSALLSLIGLLIKDASAKESALKEFDLYEKWNDSLFNESNFVSRLDKAQYKEMLSISMARAFGKEVSFKTMVWGFAKLIMSGFLLQLIDTVLLFNSMILPLGVLYILFVVFVIFFSFLFATGMKSIINYLMSRQVLFTRADDLALYIELCGKDQVLRQSYFDGLKSVVVNSRDLNALTREIDAKLEEYTSTQINELIDSTKESIEMLERCISRCKIAKEKEQIENKNFNDILRWVSGNSGIVLPFSGRLSRLKSAIFKINLVKVRNNVENNNQIVIEEAIKIKKETEALLDEIREHYQRIYHDEYRLDL